MKQIIECIPNISEGRDAAKVARILARVERVKGVSLLNVSQGADANRTVVTLAGEPKPVLVAAYELISAAAEEIDLRQQEGAHPRIGAADVCPLVPLAGVSQEECVELSHELAARVGQELGLPVFMYEHSALVLERRSLPSIRRGSLVGLAQRMATDERWSPDYGPGELHPRAGAVVIGARDLLIAFNVNLSTEDAAIAQTIAERVRESGRVVRNDAGQRLREPGQLPACRAIGWYMPEFSCAQVSMNLLDFRKTGMHHAYECVRREARELGVDVCGSELVGLVPAAALRDAGEFYLGEAMEDEAQLLAAAVEGLGLSSLRNFSISEQVIEKRLQEFS